MAVNKLLDLLKNKHSDKNFEARKRCDGAVTSGWKPLAFISTSTRSTMQLKWDRAMATKLGVDTDSIAGAFEDFYGPGGDIQWS